VAGEGVSHSSDFCWPHAHSDENSHTYHIDEALAGEWGYRLLEPLMIYNESHTTTNNHDPWFPGCPVFDSLNEVARFGCNFIRLNKDGEFWVGFGTRKGCHLFMCAFSCM